MNKKIRVAIDVGPLKGGDAVRGIGVHTKGLLEFLEKEKTIEVVKVDARKDDLSGYDIVHYQKFNPYFLSIPLIKKSKSILTIHDLVYLIYPDKYPPGVRGRLNFFLQRLLVKNMDAIITISETSKKDIVRFLGIPPEKIHVVYLAPRAIFKPSLPTSILYSIEVKYGLPKKFVLYVGDVNYNKNISGLVAACRLAKIPLVIVGKQAKELETMNLSHPELSYLVRPRAEIIEHSIRLGFINDDDLVAIYNLAAVYCQPSFYEGFGLPVLEAFACGTPVIAARTQALVEVAGGAALFCDPQSTKDIAQKISMMLADEKLRSSLIKAAASVVKKFSWQKTAKEAIAVYRQVLKND